MRDLLDYITKNNSLFLFLLLEGIALYLVVQYNRQPNRIWFSTAGTFSGYITEKYDNTKQFVYSAEVARELADSNAKLYEKLDNSKFDNMVLTDSVSLSSFEQKYTFTEAKVIDNSINLANNFITLNRGTKHGIEAHSGLITNNGLAGIVVKVNEHYSVALSLLHRQTNISCALSKNGYFGTLRWENNDPRRMILNDVPKHADIAFGDSIVTSGYSDIFPRGLFVGQVDSFWVKPGSGSYKISVALNNDMCKLQYAYIIKNLMKAEIEALEASGRNE